MPRLYLFAEGPTELTFARHNSETSLGTIRRYTCIIHP